MIEYFLVTIIICSTKSLNEALPKLFIFPIFVNISPWKKTNIEILMFLLRKSRDILLSYTERESAGFPRRCQTLIARRQCRNAAQTQMRDLNSFFLLTKHTFKKPALKVPLQ
jgi:hypothetical protein